MATVLLVEDNDDLREMMALALQMAGNRVVCARNGQEALGVLQHRPRPCVILLDLMMPVMDGWTFRAALERDAHLSKIPVVVVSALGADVAGRLHATAVIPKPVDLDELLDVVCEYCDEHGRGGARGAPGDGGAPERPD